MLDARRKIQNPNTTKSKVNPKSQIQNSLDLFGSIGIIGIWDLFGSIGNI